MVSLIRALFLGGGSFGGGTLDSHDLLLGGETTYPPGSWENFPGSWEKSIIDSNRSPYLKKQLIPIVLAVSPKKQGGFHLLVDLESIVILFIFLFASTLFLHKGTYQKTWKN